MIGIFLIWFWPFILYYFGKGLKIGLKISAVILAVFALGLFGFLFKEIVLDTFIVFFKEFPVMTTLVVSPFIALDIWLTRKIIKKRKQKKESEQSES